MQVGRTYLLGAAHCAQHIPDKGASDSEVWNLTFLKKVIFLDADTLLLQPIDDLVDHPSAFAAAPDTFPADQFNSGVMVITPNSTRFKEVRAALADPHEITAASKPQSSHQKRPTIRAGQSS